MNRNVLKSVIAGILLLCGLAHGGEVIVIANAQVSETSLDAGSLKSTFLGKKKKWSNNTKIVLACLREGETAESFFKDAVNKTPKQFLTYWKKMVFTGKGSMPRLFDNEADLVAYVRMTDGAVGFIQAETPHEGVKTITISP